MKPILVQKDNFMCGPVAIWNSMSLFGVNPPSLKLLRELCNCTSSRHPDGPGTNWTDMRQVLESFNFKTIKRKQVKPGHIYIALVPSSSGRHWLVLSDYGMHNHWFNGRYVKTRDFTSKELVRLFEIKLGVD